MISNRSFYISVLAFITTILLVLYIHHKSKPSFIKSDLDKFPLKIDGFIGHNLYLPKFVFKTINPDSYIYRFYLDDKGHKIVLFISYYSTAKGGRTTHRIYTCLLGAGWHILKISDLEISPSEYKENVKIKYVLSKKGSNYLVVLYWYQVERNTVVSSGIELNLYRFKNMILHGRCASEYVLIFSPTSKMEISETKEIAKRFAIRVISELSKYWPIEQ